MYSKNGISQEIIQNASIPSSEIKTIFAKLLFLETQTMDGFIVTFCLN
jgi:hypothetical protein